MSKRAALIITDALNVCGTTRDGGYSIGYWEVETSPQLLADLRILADPDWDGTWDDLKDAAARVRALLPEEGEDESV